MQDYEIKNPGLDRLAQTLRKTAAAAISNLEGVVSGGGTPDPDLAAFFLDAARLTPGYVAPSVDMPVTSAVVANAAQTQLMSAKGANTGIMGALMVEDRKLLAAKLPTNAVIVKTGARYQFGGFQHTITVTNGEVTNIASVAI